MQFLVEDFLPERVDFALALPDAQTLAGGVLPYALDARWLFGAPAANLPVDGRVRYAPARDLPGFDGFVFGLHDDPTRPRATACRPARPMPRGITRAGWTFPTR